MARAAGIEAFLSKPVRQSALFGGLATLMGSAPTDRGHLITAHTVAEAKRGARAHLLVVEDNIVNQKVAARTLESMGYRVDVAANGAEAVEALRRVPYAAVLMDCQMPEMDGYEATSVIRRQEGDASHTPIIAMTAGASTDDERRCLEAGMDAYVSKPVWPEKLADLLDRFIPKGTDAKLPTAAKGDAALDPKTLAFLKELGERDADGTGEMVGIFLRDARSRIDTLWEASAAGDAATVLQVAHSLKGSSASLAAKAMATLCAELENSPGDQRSLDATIDRLEEEFVRVSAALRESFTITG